ncbi:hypothetical protein LDENG_00271060 [Lucifuga dentata]|nr:hypothetical protein LDENG_00271060 [Lucifuga dentata]
MVLEAFLPVLTVFKSTSLHLQGLTSLRTGLTLRGQQGSDVVDSKHRRVVTPAVHAVRVRSVTQNALINFLAQLKAEGDAHHGGQEVIVLLHFGSGGDPGRPVHPHDGSVCDTDHTDGHLENTHRSSSSSAAQTLQHRRGAGRLHGATG